MRVALSSRVNGAVAGRSGICAAAAPSVPTVTRTTFRPVLVDVGVAMYVLRTTAETIAQMVESGEVMWVWNVTRADGGRNLRFWLAELMDPAPYRRAQPANVIDLVIGHSSEPRLRSSTVSNLMMVHRSDVLRLLLSGELTGPLEGHTQWVSRGSLRDFLQRRLVR